jgi:excisionase family DNA binding protein
MSQAVPDSSTATHSEIRNRRDRRRVPVTIPSHGDGLLSEADTCDALRVSRGTLRRMEKKGQLLPIRIGKSVRWRISDVRRFLERCS